MKKKILVLGAGRKTRGGITAVIKAHEQTITWEKWNCKWIETYIDRSAFYKFVYFIKGLFQFLIEISNARMVHIHFSGATSTKRKSIFIKIAKLFHKPIILHFHAFSSDDTIFGKNRKLYEILFHDATVIIALSSIWKEQIAKATKNPAKIEVIYNPCPSIKLDLKIKKQKTILFAGTLNQRKGYIDLIKAFSLISHKYNDWTLIFAGNGEIEAAKLIAIEYKVDSQTIFKGWVSGEEKNEIFNSASIFCLPSYAEGFPMAILDAWAYGIPVLTTPVGGLPDILVHLENALVFEPGDIKNLAKNLEELICNKELREKLSKASLKQSQESFNINTISNQLNELYNRLINK